MMEFTPKPAIAGKVAIVTGASSGIGEATARAIAMAGAIVVLAARRLERLERLAKEIRSAGRAALPVPTDLTNIDQIQNLVRATLAAYGRIDVLVNAAGWGRYDWLEEMTPKDLRMQYEVNVIGMAELTRQVLPVMKAQRSGHILNMSSYASKIAVPPLTVYASTKYAVEGLTDGLRRELIPWGIRVSRIHPSGVTGTEFNQKAKQEGGIEYRSFPIGKVTREKVAQEMVKLVEKPRQAIFLSRLYDFPVVLNKLFPGLVDFISSTWVRWKRREELLEPHLPTAQPVRYSRSPLTLPVAALLFASVILFRSRRKG